MNLENSWHVVLPKATYGDGNGELSVESGVNVPEVDGGRVAGVDFVDAHRFRLVLSTELAR